MGALSPELDRMRCSMTEETGGSIQKQRSSDHARRAVATLEPGLPSGAYSKSYRQATWAIRTLDSGRLPGPLFIRQVDDDAISGYETGRAFLGDPEAVGGNASSI